MAAYKKAFDAGRMSLTEFLGGVRHVSASQCKNIQRRAKLLKIGTTNIEQWRP